jgi:phosphonate transport system substrate-binding protein
MKKKFNIIFTGLIILIAASCTNNDEAKEVNLSRTSLPKGYQKNVKQVPKLSIAISTMISPIQTFNLYKDLIDYISKKLHIDIIFKQRRTYKEVNDLLAKNELDFAFVCTGAYLELIRSEVPIEILAVPVVNGKPYYRAYIIVNEKSNIDKLEDLKGTTFAFTDPLSNTGYSYIVGYLQGKGTTPEKFFSKTIFTYAHDYSIQAVKKNIVDGATVDGLIYEYLKLFQPDKVDGIKIIHKSREFGIPPFVVQKNLDIKYKQKLREVMLSMHLDPEGKKLLSKIMIEKFILGDVSIYK